MISESQYPLLLLKWNQPKKLPKNQQELRDARGKFAKAEGVTPDGVIADAKTSRAFNNRASIK